MVHCKTGLSSRHRASNQPDESAALICHFHAFLAPSTAGTTVHLGFGVFFFFFFFFGTLDIKYGDVVVVYSGLVAIRTVLGDDQFYDIIHKAAVGEDKTDGGDTDPS